MAPKGKAVAAKAMVKQEVEVKQEVKLEDDHRDAGASSSHALPVKTEDHDGLTESDDDPMDLQYKGDGYEVFGVDEVQAGDVASSHAAFPEGVRVKKEKKKKTGSQRATERLHKADENNDEEMAANQRWLRGGGNKKRPYRRQWFRDNYEL